MDARSSRVHRRRPPGYLLTYVQPRGRSHQSTPKPLQRQNTAPSYLSYLALNRISAAPATVTSDTATPPSPSIATVKPDTAASHRGSLHDISRASTPPAQQPPSPPPTALALPATPAVHPWNASRNTETRRTLHAA
ncbi:hypothetical protein LshimejAT787_1104980 [Lyophyllum shimeji]|uniref:Uncharacterized protein n=1 Tax=Lyophyllum shimeji TaxID=47721 RepID=A0A9P3PVS2_LYOSH|nr:hypothetical protein LshimejAT787_1104980 [Lyophyllum shimeji]